VTKTKNVKKRFYIYDFNETWQTLLIKWVDIEQIFMKLFRTSNIEIVHYRQTVFGCELPSVLLVTRYQKFIKNLTCTSV